jgi:RHS repeat-associated protein
MLSVVVNAKNQIDDSGFVYDAAGNLVQTPAPGALVMAYDAENRMTSAAGVSYSYDGDGKRVAKSNGKLYWHPSAGLRASGMSGLDVLVETDATGNNPAEYIFFGGKRIARRDPDGAVLYYFADHLGSSRVVTNVTGTIVDESDYYPFGGERIVVNNDPNPYKFTSKERDGESGLDNFGVRYFGSAFGRFMSPDDFWKDSSVRDPQSWNKYAYARNNPLRYVDPTGEKATVTTNCTTNDQNQTTCNVQISASIAIYATEGSNLTEQQLHEAASIIESSIEEAWRGSFVQDGVTYNVTTDISVSVAPSEQAALESGAQNVIGLSNAPHWRTWEPTSSLGGF